jgi:hypothetical protein
LAAKTRGARTAVFFTAMPAPWMIDAALSGSASGNVSPRGGPRRCSRRGAAASRRAASYDWSVSMGETEDLDFASVGRFAPSVPSAGAPGLYRYNEPYRGPGHYDLQQRLGRGEAVRCRLANVDGTVVRFIVCGCPEHGVLNVAFTDD